MWTYQSFILFLILWALAYAVVKFNEMGVKINYNSGINMYEFHYKGKTTLDPILKGLFITTLEAIKVGFFKDSYEYTAKKY